MWEMDKQADGPLLISFKTVAHKCQFYLHIDSISQMDNLCCLWFALEEEWGVKAALKAGTPLAHAIWAACRPWGVASHSASVALFPLTDGPHSTTVCLTLPCFLSAVKCNVITPLYNQNSNYSTGASPRSLKGAYLSKCATAFWLVFTVTVAEARHVSDDRKEYCSIYWTEQIEKCSQRQFIS